MRGAVSPMLGLRFKEDFQFENAERRRDFLTIKPKKDGVAKVDDPHVFGDCRESIPDTTAGAGQFKI